MVGGRRYMVRIGVDVRTCGHELLDNGTQLKCESGQNVHVHLKPLKT